MGRASGRTNLAAGAGAVARRRGPATPPSAALVSAIHSIISDEEFIREHKLLETKYMGNPRPYAGHCYVASEVYYHLSGGKAAGLKACGLKLSPKVQHWWV